MHKNLTKKLFYVSLHYSFVGLKLQGLFQAQYIIYTQSVISLFPIIPVCIPLIKEILPRSI